MASAGRENSDAGLPEADWIMEEKNMRRRNKKQQTIAIIIVVILVAAMLFSLIPAFLL